MSIRVVTGPPFSGKSQAVAKVRRAGDVLIDTTVLWKALYSPETGAIRTMEQARVAQAAKMAALRRAVALDLDGWLTVAERDPIQLKRWLDAAGQQKAWLVTEPMETLIRRARAAGPECEELSDRVGRLRGRCRLHGSHRTAGARKRCELFTTSRRSTGRRWKG